MSETMNLSEVMGHMTLRQMETAETLWREHAGPEGPKLQDALSSSNYRAMAAMVAAKMRMNGHPEMTLDEAMDLELDVGTDVGEVLAANDGGKQSSSLATGP